MNLNFTAELNRQDIEQMVRKYMSEAMPGHEVERIDFLTNTNYDWRGEASGHVFGGVKVKLKVKADKPASLAGLEP